MSHSEMLRKRSFRGALPFTLIELLVVVAIVAVLMSMLLPGLSNAKAIAGRISCGGKLKQLALAGISYTADNKEFFTYGGYAWNEGSNQISWDSLLYGYDGRRGIEPASYVSSAQPPLYKCSIDPGRWGTWATRSYSMNAASWTNASGFNPPSDSPSNIRGLTCASGYGYGVTDPWSLPLLRVKRPSRLIMITEYFRDSNILGLASGCCVNSPYSQTQYFGVSHLGRFNYAFVDGHLDILRQADTVAPLGGSLTKPYGIWDRDTQGF